MKDLHERTGADLMVIAQFVAFSLSTLASLGQSVQNDLTDMQVVRLRANAVTCSRQAEAARRTMATAKHVEPQPREQQPSPAPQRTDTNARHRPGSDPARAAWADALATMVQDLQAIPRQKQSVRDKALNGTALAAAITPPFGLAPPLPE